MKVWCIICPICNNKVFSRHVHDFRECHGYFIDGGQSYTRIGGWKTGENPPEQIEIEIKQTSKQLYDDWNTGKDKFGLIKPKNHTKNE